MLRAARERFSCRSAQAGASPCQPRPLGYKRRPRSHIFRILHDSDHPPPSHTPRVEDDALVRGHGRFMDDPRLPNQAYAAFVRSPHAMRA